MTDTLQEISERIAQATASRTPLRIRGGGTKDWYGQSLQGEVLDTRQYQGIISYEPTELVIVVRSGTPLAEVEQILAENRQMLAFEPPYFGQGATIGGAMASGLSGPGRQARGAVRDFMLGSVLIDGKGDILRFGGQVMKNVAGYDVSRLLAGSLGTLGLIAEMSIKVLPSPFMEITLRFEMAEEEAIMQLNRWGGQPLPISASAWHQGVLLVRLSGADAAIQSAKLKMGGEEVSQAAGLWKELREQQLEFFTTLEETQSLWRLSVTPVASPIKLPGQQLIEWGGAQRWLKTGITAATVREAAAKAGGHATLFRGGTKSVGVFHPLEPAIENIHRKLKNAFDPAGIFNPGRMYNAM